MQGSCGATGQECEPGRRHRPPSRGCGSDSWGWEVSGATRAGDLGPSVARAPELLTGSGGLTAGHGG